MLSSMGGTLTLSPNKILDWSELKAFVDDKINAIKRIFLSDE